VQRGRDDRQRAKAGGRAEKSGLSVFRLNREQKRARLGLSLLLAGGVDRNEKACATDKAAACGLSSIARGRGFRAAPFCLVVPLP